MIASSSFKPAMGDVSALTMPLMEMTAAWVVPAPMLMTIFPVGVLIGKSMPIAAASG